MSENEPIVQPLGAQSQKKRFDVNNNKHACPDDYHTAMRELNAKCWQLSREILERDRK
jgi:hypothetical protein